MSEQITLTKELIGVEDLLIGTGTVAQVRNGTSLAIARLNLAALSEGAITTTGIDTTLNGDVDLAAGKQLSLDLVANDLGFVDFNGTAGADAGRAISTLTTPGATTHHIQIAINGTPAWIAVSTNDPT